MSCLFRPKIVEYRLPNGSYRTADGKRVTKSTPGAVRNVTESPTWWGKYTDAQGREHKKRLSEKKEIARRMLAKLSGDSQLAGAGIEDRFAEHRTRPLAEHAADFGRYLAAKGNSTDHVTRTVARCRKILDSLEAEQIEDLQPSAVLEVLAVWRQDESLPDLPSDVEQFTKAELVVAVRCSGNTLSRVFRRLNLDGEGYGKARRYSRGVVEALREHFGRGAGVVTTNHYITAIKGFTRWLARERRTPIDPLAYLSHQNVAADLRHVRRALLPAEFAVLLRWAASAHTFRGLSGPDRATLYLLAARSGLRASELASLSPSSFDFNAPSVTVEAAYSKRKRKDVQPLPADVAEELRLFCEGKAQRGLLWPGTWPDVGADVLRNDLAGAGIAYIDEAGGVYDFHALRHQFITDMVASGVHAKDAQSLARHSTITLTMDRYAHVRKADLRTALDRLPTLKTADHESEAHARRA
jgi:integrase